ncbi:DUF2784 domain-containing protein [Algoriphagus sp.]|uniref:DUF2784 domain-containing protein n=1 Tax=Algoriphagus sp. TaxID=1872435 RepID=UPI00271D8F3D|nr:DUF2784 domain-containing protein [Algoriphagus sp.]MDO8967419.1 DUF2784 domain-containing protein [Algoriphagus sp.]MDP3198326.1 DUF2784 domain-containing protein [Algoriphagus sp.]
MSDFFLHLLDIFFFAFHTIFILFNIFGWLVPRWRMLNLLTLSLTAFSWFILGIWYGWGYCFCTDWHWEVRELLGYQNLSDSYIHFLILKLTGINLPPHLVDTGTALVFFSALFCSIYLNVKNWRNGYKKGDK